MFKSLTSSLHFLWRILIILLINGIMISILQRTP